MTYLLVQCSLLPTVFFQVLGPADRETRRRLFQQQQAALAAHYPDLTGAPPNTPLVVPKPASRARPRAVNIVSLGGESVEATMRRHQARTYLPSGKAKTTIVSSSTSLHDGKTRGAGAGAGGAAAEPSSSSSNSVPALTADKAAGPGSRPGVDLPHLPLRYSEAKDASNFVFTPRERPSRMSVSRGKRPHGLGALRTSTAPARQDFAPPDLDPDFDSRSSVNDDPYADCFRHESSVVSVGEVLHWPYNGHHDPGLALGQALSGRREGSMVGGPSVGEPLVMLTVQEEDDEAEPISLALRPGGQIPLLPQYPGGPAPTLGPAPAQESGLAGQAALREQRVRHFSLTSNASASSLAVPLAVKEWDEGRPPSTGRDRAGGGHMGGQGDEMTGREHEEGIVVRVPSANQALQLELERTQTDLYATGDGGKKEGERKEGEGEGEGEGGDGKPEREGEKSGGGGGEGEEGEVEGEDASRDTARTIATQTSPTGDEEAGRRPALVKVTTLTMFPDIGGGGGDTGGGGGGGGGPTLRMTHGSQDPLLDAVPVSLPHLRRRLLSQDKPDAAPDVDQASLPSQGEEGEGQGEEDGEGDGEDKSKINGVKNLTFISPLAPQGNAKRF